jgi:hypothetical protein
VLLRQALEKVLREWPAAVQEPFTGHPLANFIRNDLAAIIAEIVKRKYPSFTVASGPGAGNWASVPWVSILNPLVTATTQDGVYPVYLFCADGSGVYLSLNQGTTRPKQQLGAFGADRQAEVIKRELQSRIPRLKDWGGEEISLRSNTNLGRSYEKPNITARYYSLEALPDDQQLVNDLVWMMEVNLEVGSFWGGLKLGDATGNTVNPANGTGISGTKPFLSNTASVTIPKPFLLLAGISGTGKTRFVREQATISADAFNLKKGENYCLVPVRPDWHEPSDLLGYLSRLGGKGARFVVTDVLTFIVAAWKHAAASAEATGITLRDLDTISPYWLCLDEMNLAPVEQYFADYLSIVETRRWEKGDYSCDPLLKGTAISQLDDDGRAELWEKLQLPNTDPVSFGLRAYFSENGIPLPPNLIVAGTVNMDETTHGFSRKVIDRALTIDFGDFFPNDFATYYSADRKISHRPLDFPRLSFIQAESDLAAVPADPDGRKTIAFLAAVNALLVGTPFALAYRALNEILLSVASLKPAEDIALKAVWDDYLMMKVLPRIEGDADKLSFTGEESLLTCLQSVLRKELDGVWDEKIRPDLFRTAINGPDEPVECRSKLKLEWMQKRLVENSFTSFWP